MVGWLKNPETCWLHITLGNKIKWKFKMTHYLGTCLTRMKLSWVLALVWFLDSCLLLTTQLAATRRHPLSTLVGPAPRVQEKALSIQMEAPGRFLGSQQIHSRGWFSTFPGGAMSVTCEGLISSPRIKDPLLLASSQSLQVVQPCCAPGLDGAALPPRPAWRVGVVHSRSLPCAL